MPIYEPWEVLNLLVPHTHAHTQTTNMNGTPKHTRGLQTQQTQLRFTPPSQTCVFVVVLCVYGGGGCKVKEERRLARERAREERKREKEREKEIERERLHRYKQQEKNVDLGEGEGSLGRNG